MHQRIGEVLLSRVRIGLLALGSLLTWFACDAGEIAAPPGGTISIMTSTFGHELDSDGYTVSIDDTAQVAIPAHGSLLHDRVRPGFYRLRLTGIASNCSVQGQNPLTVEVQDGDHSPAVFAISCSASTGSLEIATVTTGPTPHPAGYSLRINSDSGRPLGINSVVTLSGLAVGRYSVALDDELESCSVAGENPREVTVAAGLKAAVQFSITCGAVVPGSHSGIMFGTWHLDDALIGAVHTGTLRSLGPENIVPELSAIRAGRGRVIANLAGGDQRLLTSEGRFSLEQWKSQLDKFRVVDIGSYITDGTIVGHYMIDEPHRAARWGDPIPRSTIEVMAQYSRQLWPGLATLVRVVPSWLADGSVTYQYLDAGWIQYTSRQGDPGPWLAAEVAVAKRLGLGVVLSMNMLDGGTSSSGIPGYTEGKFAMSATELRSYGTTLLSESYGCAFMMWKYDPVYHARPDIQSALATLSVQASSHASTSCRQRR